MFLQCVVSWLVGCVALGRFSILVEEGRSCDAVHGKRAIRERCFACICTELKILFVGQSQLPPIVHASCEWRNLVLVEHFEARVVKKKDRMQNDRGSSLSAVISAL